MRRQYLGYRQRCWAACNFDCSESSVCECVKLIVTIPGLDRPVNPRGSIQSGQWEADVYRC